MWNHTSHFHSNVLLKIKMYMNLKSNQNLKCLHLEIFNDVLIII